MGGSARSHGPLRSLLVVAVLAAALRAIIPVGYMFAFHQGEFSVVLCASAAQASSGDSQDAKNADAHRRHAGMAHSAPAQGDQRGAGHDAQVCPFSIASLGAIAAHPMLAAPGPAIIIALAPAAEKEPVEIAASPFFARGPPHLF